MHCLLFNFNKRLADNARALGCYRIAHFVREHGWDAEVIEYAAYWDLDRLKALAQSRINKNTLWIGTSHLFSVWGDVMEEFCLWVKQTYPWIKIISGASTNPSFDSAAIDYYIQGYGENSLLVLLRYLFSNGTAPKINLLASDAKKIIPIDAYPSYPMKSLMVKYQDRDFIVPGEWLGVEFARGCKFACDYCNFPVIGVKGDYTRDAEDFREQLMDAYDRWGVYGYFATDETFNDRTEKITKFADMVETLPFTPYFYGYLRADLLVSRTRDREELARMNFRGHFYGIETFNHRAGKSVGKGMEPNKLKQGLLDIRDYFEKTGNGFYSGTLSFIIGLPHETLEDIQHTLDWCRTHWKRRSSVQAWPLAIYQHEGDKPSAMSQDPESRGYQRMTPEEISAEIAKGRAVNQMIWPKSKDRSVDHNRFYYWKNEHMNVFDAAAIEQELFDERNLKNPSDNWGVSIWRHGSVVLKDLTLEQRLDLTDHDIGLLVQKNSKDIIEDYITKKLSL